ncbi:MAG: class I SAM-dependent methyltransferase [Bacteroidota bacterium]|nr:class I SAM-dependent methyltransferase [Bacteroidota bacterium]
MIAVADIKTKVDLPDDIKSSAVKFSEGVYLHDIIKKNNFKKTLETGFGLGLSACHIITATNSMHVGIDPFQVNYNSTGLKNVEKLGLSPLLEFHADFSHNVLPKLLNEKRTFDFIFIDGDHKYDGQFIDFYYADLLLEKNGNIVLHDTWMRSTAYLVNYIKTNRKDYEYVKQDLRNIAVFKKVGVDNRDWLYFRGFGTSKSYFTHKTIAWLHNTNDSFLKRMVIKLKDILK